MQEMLAKQHMSNTPEQSAITSGQEKVNNQYRPRHDSDDQKVPALKEFILKSFPDHHSQLPQAIKRYWTNSLWKMTSLSVVPSL